MSLWYTMVATMHAMVWYALISCHKETYIGTILQCTRHWYYAIVWHTLVCTISWCGMHWCNVLLWHWFSVTYIGQYIPFHSVIDIALILCYSVTCMGTVVLCYNTTLVLCLSDICHTGIMLYVSCIGTMP